MMSAEHELTTVEKYCPHVCLGSASIAAVKGVKRY
jgi:hypothetical protein